MVKSRDQLECGDRLVHVHRSHILCLKIFFIFFSFFQFSLHTITSYINYKKKLFYSWQYKSSTIKLLWCHVCTKVAHTQWLDSVTNYSRKFLQFLSAGLHRIKVKEKEKSLQLQESIPVNILSQTPVNIPFFLLFFFFKIKRKLREDKSITKLLDLSMHQHDFTIDHGWCVGISPAFGCPVWVH